MKMNITVPDDWKAALARLSKRSGIPEAQLALEGIKRVVMEDQQGEQITMTTQPAPAQTTKS